MIEGSPIEPILNLHHYHAKAAVEIETKYALKLFFPSPSFVQVYYEAVANAIDAQATEIEIRICSDGKIHDLSFLEITIRDNGVGFTDERYERFKRLKEPEDTLHKGLGRLIFLHYFTTVEVKSRYNGKQRSFTFAHNFDGKSKVTPAHHDEPSWTELVFRGFHRDRVKSYDYLRPATLKQQLLEQFLPVLYSRKHDGRPVTISITLTTEESNPQKEFFPDSRVLSAVDLPNLTKAEIKNDQVDWFEPITVSYSIEPNQTNRLILTAADVDGRTIPLSLLSPASVPIDTSVIFLFSSGLFVGTTDTARQRLVLPEGTQLSVLVDVLRQEVGRILGDELPEIKHRNDATKSNFENKFPHLIGLFDTNTAGLIDREVAIEKAQKRFFQKQRQVLESDPTDEAAFEKSLEMSARSLTEYILYRNWIIQRLRLAPANEHESILHDLIVPRREQFHQSSLVEDVYRNNAWILDDKFMTFRTILSDKAMDEVVAAITLEEDAVQDKGRPDISMIFSADPEREDRVDVVVVELKKKVPDDKEGLYANVQLRKRARRLVDHCPNIQRMWYYGIIGIDDDLEQLLLDSEWIPLHSKGRVFFQDLGIMRKPDNVRVPTPTFLLSFDAIAADAEARNHTFLELLKSRFKSREEP